jgi:hypothetical protein
VTNNLDSTYNYDLEGNPVLVAYSPAGLDYVYSYDSMERLSGMLQSPPAASPGISSATYDAANRLLQFNYLSGTNFEGQQTRQYNSLEQLINLNDGYYIYNYPAGANNGKISSAVIQGQTVTYQYDSLNRLASATGGGWGEAYGYDGFGNLLSKTPSASATPWLQQSVNAANNQIVGQSYDANGNQLTAPGVTSGVLTYDVENHMVAAAGVQYLYNSQNQRVWRGTFDSNGNLLSQTAYFTTRVGRNCRTMRSR